MQKILLEKRGIGYSIPWPRCIFLCLFDVINVLRFATALFNNKSSGHLTTKVQGLCKNGARFSTISRAKILAAVFILALQTCSWDPHLVSKSRYKNTYNKSETDFTRTQQNRTLFIHYRYSATSLASSLSYSRQLHVLKARLHLHIVQVIGYYPKKEVSTDRRLPHTTRTPSSLFLTRNTRCIKREKSGPSTVIRSTAT